MSDQRDVSGEAAAQPWWYSGPPLAGGEQEDAHDTSDVPDPDETTSVDWMGMLAGAARMVDWARGAVLDPHGDHDDPAEHPDCLICRTLVMVGDQAGMTAPGRESAGAHVVPEPAELPPIQWIPLRDA